MCFYVFVIYLFISSAVDFFSGFQGHPSTVFLSYPLTCPRSAHVAKQLAEPEDQAFHGIGARSARWTLHLVLGLTLCSAPVSTVSNRVKLCQLCQRASEFLGVFRSRDEISLH